MDNSIGIFISYSHQNRFEAITLSQELAKIGCHCWIDFKGIAGGDPWRESIEQALESSLALVVILTPESVLSKYVTYEVSLAQMRGHIIIPVMFRKCELPQFLEPYQYVDFTHGPDYETLFRSVVIGVTRRMRATHEKSASSETKISDSKTSTASSQRLPPTVLEPPSENRPLERPDGTMRAESLFYIERIGDRILQRELEDEGATVVIKAPRQVGKSSMLVRGIHFAQKRGKKAAILDFQSLDTLGDAKAFYQEFCALISDRLGLENETEEIWRRRSSNTLASTIYLEQAVLSKLKEPLVLGIDETDRMLDCEFRSDFFGMLRSWHNLRSTSHLWKRLDLVLVISTEPYMLIENSAQSPFNVGEPIELDDFSEDNVADLNERHGKPFSDTELQGLYRLTSGHPYLVRQALYRTAVGDTSPKAVLDEATYTTGNGGLFADHLRRYQSYFTEQPGLRKAILDIIHHRAELSDVDFNRLRGAGLVMLDSAHQVAPRCRLYQLYFGAKLK